VTESEDPAAVGAAERPDDEGRATRWMLAVMLAPVLVYVLVLRWKDPGPGWRAEYFRNEKLAGEALVLKERITDG